MNFLRMTTTRNSNPLNDEEDEVVSNTITQISEAQYDQEFKSSIRSFETVQRGAKKHFVRCDVCFKYPAIVRLNCDNKKPPPITSEIGIRYRKNYVLKHFQSVCHRKCREAKMIAELESCQRNKNKQLMDLHISESNQKFANHIGKLLLQVFVDAKKLTLSAYNWPSRYNWPDR